MYRHKYKFKTKKYTIELELRSRITILCYGNNTSYWFNTMYRVLNSENLILKDYKSLVIKNNYDEFLNTLAKNKYENERKLYIINQMDDIQRMDPRILNHISNDYKNDYIIIGNCVKLQFMISDIAEIVINEKEMHINYLLPEPLMHGGRER